MAIELNLEWKAAPPEIKVMAIGDVRAVINSNANKVTKLPEVTYGFGALSMSGPDRAGEGMVWRGSTGATPPTGNPEAAAGPLDGFSTPFFLGWLGEPAAQGYFSAEGNTLRQLYERLFEQIPPHYSPDRTSILLLEILGTANVEHIYDRALRKPVHEGNTLITDLPLEYFNFRIIQDDLKRRGHPPEGSLTLAIAGAGYRPGGKSSTLQRFEKTVFYEPPRLKDNPAIQAIQGEGEIKTHSHMMGWRNEERILPDLPGTNPDYVLHLDEWSQIASGSLRVFVVSPERIEFVTV